MSLAKPVTPPNALGGVNGAVNADNIGDGDVIAIPEAVGSDDEASEAGLVRPRLLTAPEPPSKQEMYEHAMCHRPYRTWCPHCVKGKAKAQYHKAREEDEEEEEEETQVPIVGVDYAFLTKTVVENPCKDELKIINAKDGKSTNVFQFPFRRRVLMTMNIMFVVFLACLISGDTRAPSCATTKRAPWLRL